MIKNDFIGAIAALIVENQSRSGIQNHPEFGTISNIKDPLKLNRIKITTEIKGGKTESDFQMRMLPFPFFDPPMPFLGMSAVSASFNGNPHDRVLRLKFTIMRDRNQNKVRITHRHKAVIRKFSLVIAISIILTIALLIISCVLALQLWKTEQDSNIYTLLVTFCIFNVGETALTIYLAVLSVTLEYENRHDISRLIAELKRRGQIDSDFTLPSPYEAKQ